MARSKARPGSGTATTDRSSTPALILFTDIRGFTTWSESIEVSIHLGRFVGQFFDLVQGHFGQGTSFKGLGDGMMIVRELPERQPDPAEILSDVLRTIERIEAAFSTLCKDFANSVGHRTDLRLGWGVVRGEVKRLGSDYVGSNVNKAARLCDIARPFGIAADAEDFPDPGRVAPSRRFHRQRRILSGLNEVDVWVTDEIASQFVTRERLKQNPEVHVAGLCLDTSNKKGLRVLLATRSPERKLFPGLIEGCGGQLAYSETFVEGVARHFRLELGIEVRVFEDIHCLYVIREPNESVIPGIRFLCELTGDTEPRSANHSLVEWVSLSEFGRLPADRFVGRLKDEGTALIEAYKSKQGKK